MAFGYYASITIDNTKVGGSSGTISNFPVLVSGTYDGTGGEPDLRSTGNGGNVTSANGYDIYFYDDASATTKYDHELIYYNASTGQYIAWVRVPTLNKGSDTTLYMHYGDSGVTVDPSSTSTWTTGNYGVVLHLNESPADSTPQYTDSTGNAHHGTMSGSNLIAGKRVVGQIFYGSDLEAGDSNVIDVNNAMSVIASDDTYVISLWVKMESTGSYIIFSRNSDGTAGQGNFYGYAPSSGQTWFRADDNSGAVDYITATPNWTIGTWYLYHFVKTAATTTTIYRNGSLMTITVQNNGAAATPAYSSTEDMRLGEYDEIEAATLHFDGVMEEFRINTTALDTDTFLTEYNNQSSPSTFYTMGSEQAAGGTPSTQRIHIGQSGNGVRVI